MKYLISKNKYVLILIFICLIVAGANYQQGTILSGWDTLHPEFNFGEYFKRIFYGVWQQHQGLGALATQGHAAEIPRVIIYYLLSFLIPDSLIRYSYFFLMLILGPLGMFFFLKEIIFKNTARKGEIFSFLGALFYLLNLTTVQHFFVPFEMFATHFASLGWLFLFTFKYLLQGKRKHLLLFALATILSSSIAHTATLWYSYFLGYCIYLLSLNVLAKKRNIINRSLLVALLSIFLNLFWILPELYFAVYHGALISQSKIHALFTQEAFAQNAAFGRIEDLAIFRNFLFNWGIYTGNGHFALLLDQWITHLKNPFILAIGYAFSIIAAIGIFSALKNKNKTHLSFLPILGVAIFFWLNINPPLGFLFKFLQENIPLFKEALRFPFTKFSILLIFSVSIYFSLGLNYLDNLSQKIRKNELFSHGLLLFVTLLLFVYMLPVFKGYLISPYMKVQIPSEYFEMFAWFNKKNENGRVATLPINSFWGWSYYNWSSSGTSQWAGYQGAGFIWFGIKQPILDREFDRWSPYNEQYYREMSQAVYTKNPVLFNQVIKKYNIRYILVDENVVSPESYSSPQILFLKEIDGLLKKSDIESVSKFGNSLAVYTIKESLKNSQAYILEKPVSISPTTSAYYEDFAFSRFSDYVTQESDNEIYYPFRNILDNQNHFLIKTTSNSNGLTFNANTNIANFTTPSIESFDDFIPANIFLEKTATGLDILLYPSLPINNLRENPAPLIVKAPLPKTESFVVSINKSNNFLISSLPGNTQYSLGRVLISTKQNNPISVYSSESEKITPDFSNPIYSLYICGEGKKSQLFGVTNTIKSSFSLFSQNNQLCMMTPLKSLEPEISEKLSTIGDILLNVSYNYKGKNAPNICIANLTDSNCLYYLSKNINFKGENGKKISQYFAIKTSDFTKLGIKIFIDSRDEEKVVQSFDDFSVGITNSLFSVDVTPDLIQESIKDISVKKGSGYKVSAFFSGGEQLSKDITKQPRTEGDCPIANPRGPNPTGREVIKEESANYIRYTSQEGSFCDHFSYLGLPQNQAYLISIVSRNVKGLPIRMCITNSNSRRCDLYTHLTQSTEFKEETFLLPGMGQNQSFDININNFAIKRVPTVNDIKSISIVPVSYNWLSNLTEGTAVNNSKRIDAESVINPNPSLYMIDLGKNTAEGNVLTISQSYDEGWKAYAVADFGLLNIVFPFILGEEINNHIIVNNWENGWKISNQTNNKVVVIYQPQYLEYLGLTLLIFPLIYVFLIHTSLTKTAFFDRIL